MAAEPLDIRMARPDGAYVQIKERLEAIEQRLTNDIGRARAEIGALRAELRGDLSIGLGSLRTDLGTGLGLARGELITSLESVRMEIANLRKQMSAQFYWLLTLILGAILVLLLRDLAR